VAWRGLAEVVEKYVKKGSRLYIEGRIKTRSWDDKDGGKHYITEIYADNMEMLARREGQAETAPQNGRAEQLQSVSEPDLNQPEEDDLPF
jgi:single-strand DNA-binding protein